MEQQLNPAAAQLLCVVRPSKRGDYDKMAELAGQLGYKSTEAEVRSRLDKMRDSNHYAVYVAEFPGGQIAGWIGLYMFRTVTTDGCAEISGLVVDQDVRSRGIGKALLDIAEQWARSHGCDAISVRSNVTRDRAHRFYSREGYEYVKTQKSLRKSL